MNNFTPRAQQVLALARKEADRFNHNFVGTEHLLLGLIKLGQGVAVNVLQKLGLDLETPPPRGRVITTGEFGGLAGFEHVYERLGITFGSKAEATQVLDLVRYATAHNQLNLTDDELRFIAKYPDQVRQILTITP